MIILCKQLLSKSYGHEHSEQRSIKGAHMTWVCVINGLKKLAFWQASTLNIFKTVYIIDVETAVCTNMFFFTDIAVDEYLFLYGKH